MRRRRLILLAAVFLLVAGGSIWFFTREREPSYNGKTLTAWLELYYRPKGSAGDRAAAADAVQHIGTNAIPLLFHWIRYEPPPWRTKLDRFLNKLPLPWVVNRWFSDPAEYKAAMASGGFAMLGSEAKPAIPELMKLLDAPKTAPGVSGRATLALAEMGNVALPAVLEAIADPGRSNRIAYIRMLPLLAGLGNGIGCAAPVLLACVKDEDGRVAREAAHVLGQYQLEPDTVIPALIGNLDDPRPHVRIASLLGLARYGRKAEAAVPALQRAFYDRDPSVSSAARSALMSIAPDAPELGGGK